MSRSSRLVGATAVAGTALVVLGAVYLVLPSPWSTTSSPDYRTFYRPVAENLLAGTGLVDAAGEPAVRYPPGFPLVLAAAFGVGRLVGLSPETAATVLVFLLFVATAAIVFLLAEHFWGRHGGWLAALVWTTYPPAIWLAKQPGSELLFLPLLGATLLLFFRQVNEIEPPSTGPSTIGWHLVVGPSTIGWHLVVGHLAVGVLAGCAMLVRPVAIGLGVLLALLYLALRHRSAGRRAALLGACLILAGNAVTIAPWELWAYQSTGRVLPLSSGGPASVADGLTFGVRDKGYRQGTWIPTPTRELMASIDRRYEPGTPGGELLALVADEAAQHPFGFAALVALKAGRSWYGTDSQRHELALALVQLPYLVLAALALWACRAGPPRQRLLATVVLALVAYFWAMSILVLSLARYMVPTYALLALTIPALLHRRPSR